MNTPRQAEHSEHQNGIGTRVSKLTKGVSNTVLVIVFATSTILSIPKQAEAQEDRYSEVCGSMFPNYEDLSLLYWSKESFAAEHFEKRKLCIKNLEKNLDFYNFFRINYGITFGYQGEVISEPAGYTVKFPSGAPFIPNQKIIGYKVDSEYISFKYESGQDVKFSRYNGIIYDPNGLIFQQWINLSLKKYYD